MNDAFDTMFPRRAPMTADEARNNVAAMQADTNPKAMRRVLQLALGPIGNLTDDARAIYAAALAA